MSGGQLVADFYWEVGDHGEIRIVALVFSY